METYAAVCSCYCLTEIYTDEVSAKKAAQNHVSHFAVHPSANAHHVSVDPVSALLNDANWARNYACNCKKNGIHEAFCNMRKPRICKCGEAFCMYGSSLCEDCYNKKMDEFSDVISNAYGPGKNI